MGLPSTPTHLPKPFRPDKTKQTPRYFADLHLEHAADLAHVAQGRLFTTNLSFFVAANEYQSEPPTISDKILPSQPEPGS